MLYQTEEVKGNLEKKIDGNRAFYGEGRGETGVCLHVHLKNHVAGGANQEDYDLMIYFTNMLIEYLMYKRPVKGPENWDYDNDKVSEISTVCGDNPTTSGIDIFDTGYPNGPKLQVTLEKTFGANEISIRWKSGLIPYGQLEDLLKVDSLEYLQKTYGKRASQVSSESYADLAPNSKPQ